MDRKKPTTNFTISKGICLFGVLFFLNGCEPATTVATTVAGVVGIGLLEERSSESGIKDRQIQMNIHLAINNQKETGHDIFVLVYQQEVMLAGFVATEEQREKVAKIAENTKYVQRLTNKIRVGQQDTMQYFTDRSLGIKISTSLSLEKGVHAVNYVIRVIDGVVYMMGLALSDEELRKVNSTISQIQGVRGVVSLIKVRPPKEISPSQIQVEKSLPAQVKEVNEDKSSAVVDDQEAGGFAEETINVEALEPIGY